MAPRPPQPQASTVDASTGETIYFMNGVTDEADDADFMGLHHALSPAQQLQLSQVQKSLASGWTVHLTNEGRFYYCK